MRPFRLVMMLGFSLVVGCAQVTAAPDFSVGYNPVSIIPLVVVIGKSGELVDYQIGVQPDDGPRLEQALVSAALR